MGVRYSVQDGHHRVSVAWALEQKAIEDTVEVWQVDGPLPWQQLARALAVLFQHLSVDLTGNIKEAGPQSWARPLFTDLITLGGDHECPQGTPNARHVATLAGLESF